MLGCEATWAQAVLQDHVTHMGQKDFLPYTIITKGIGIVKQQIHFFLPLNATIIITFLIILNYFHAIHTSRKSAQLSQKKPLTCMHSTALAREALMLYLNRLHEC